MFEHFLRCIIERNEGAPFSGDKISFIIKQVKKAVITGENQGLYADYTGCERIAKECWNEKAYWSPDTFKDTDEVFDAFWKWYREPML